MNNEIQTTSGNIEPASHGGSRKHIESYIRVGQQRPFTTELGCAWRGQVDGEAPVWRFTSSTSHSQTFFFFFFLLYSLFFSFLCPLILVSYLLFLMLSTHVNFRVFKYHTQCIFFFFTVKIFKSIIRKFLRSHRVSRPSITAGIIDQFVRWLTWETGRKLSFFFLSFLLSIISCFM